ncbi:hypothetical protein PBI_SCTP2_426 [Salicola phage SCTP-2]|nr:hypothetical protein PBI_SCTP2_426 [Salicola phage SCTP-2]
MRKVYNKILSNFMDLIGLKRDGEREVFVEYVNAILLGIVILSAVLFSAQVFASDDYTETDYVDHYCPIVSSEYEIENVMEDGTRIDCHTSTEAIEFDYARKWYECIGQSLHYSRLTGEAPVCALIVDQDSDLEKEYVERARKTVEHFDLPVRIFTVDSTVK